MKHVKVNAETYRDNSAKSINLPTILIEYNGKIQIIKQLHEYQIKYHTKSRSWHKKLIQAIGLLLDYLEANENNYNGAKQFFAAFADAIYSGTINEDGYDPSGLYWLPKRTANANMLLMALNGFSDWLYKEYGAVQLNPWREATSYEQRLNWMAQINKSHHSFLGHLDSSLDMTETARQVRNVMNRRKPASTQGATKAFPEDKIEELLMEGFKKTRKGVELPLIDRYNWRDMAITILMHFGGLRHSEVFHLWVHDVYPDPKDPDLAVVRIYHPSEGKAPQDFKNPVTGKYITDRETYLLLRYGLLPRNKYAANDRRFAGWKEPLLNDGNDKYMHVFWSSKEWGYIFMYVWKMYMAQRLREGIQDTHPFAFVSFHHQYKGDMMSLSTQRESHAKAVQKIGLTVSKGNGTTEHGHRHAYGQRLKNLGLSSNEIRVAMHHKSIESQAVYTEPTISDVTASLSKATVSLEEGIQLPMVTEIDAWFDEDKKYQKRYTYKGK
ncbi:MAG: gamma-mobile-trio recombinase GmtY [Clostridiaceae bacterium]|nr:gamma-mobile-trio recombinase GmtY [Clostridiaceae bacterium]